MTRKFIEKQIKLTLATAVILLVSSFVFFVFYYFLLNPFDELKHAIYIEQLKTMKDCSNIMSVALTTMETIEKVWEVVASMVNVFVIFLFVESVVLFLYYFSLKREGRK